MLTENDPFARLPEVPTFALTSETLTAGAAWPDPQMSAGLPGGGDRSPHLIWSGAPKEAKSYVVTVYDPDAPTGSGFWHWVVVNIPANVTQLAEGAGAEGGTSLPQGAIQIPNDARAARFLGAAPPPGHGPHRYFVVVHALDVERLDLPADVTPALVGFLMFGHVLARAVLTVTAEVLVPS